MNLEERLERIERLLSSLIDRQQVKEWYSVDELARITGRSVFTCREWCRLGRIAAEKRACVRGVHPEWRISHEEVRRYQCDGLLPIRSTNPA